MIIQRNLEHSDFMAYLNLLKLLFACQACTDQLCLKNKLWNKTGFSINVLSRFCIFIACEYFLAVFSVLALLNTRFIGTLVVSLVFGVHLHKDPRKVLNLPRKDLPLNVFFPCHASKNLLHATFDNFISRSPRRDRDASPGRRPVLDHCRADAAQQRCDADALVAGDRTAAKTDA